MKLFSSLLAVAGVAPFGVTSTMGLPSPGLFPPLTSPATIISQLEAFAAQSRALQASVAQLDESNFLLQGQIITQSIDNITNAVGVFLDNVGGGPPFDDDAAQQIVSALGDFADANSALMFTVIEKHTLAAAFQAKGPISEALSRSESVFDHIKGTFDRVMETAKELYQKIRMSMGVSIRHTIDVYSQ